MDTYLVFTRQISMGRFLKLPKVTSNKNLGEHLNEVFADRSKMEAAPSLQIIVLPESIIVNQVGSMVVVSVVALGNQWLGAGWSHSLVQAACTPGAQSKHGWVLFASYRLWLFKSREEWMSGVFKKYQTLNQVSGVNLHPMFMECSLCFVRPCPWSFSLQCAVRDPHDGIPEAWVSFFHWELWSPISFGYWGSAHPTIHGWTGWRLCQDPSHVRHSGFYPGVGDWNEGWWWQFEAGIGEFPFSSVFLHLLWKSFTSFFAFPQLLSSYICKHFNLWVFTLGSSKCSYVVLGLQLLPTKKPNG